jgi:hypothetical protein
MVEIHLHSSACHHGTVLTFTILEYLVELRTMSNSKNSRWPGSDSNRELCDYKSEPLPFHPDWS